ncbi:MAG: hypothetical protein ABW049_06395 [Spongiibacteraceae bacterium]
MSDIHSAPPAPLTETIAEYGSLERGIAGDYQFSIGATLSEAWAKTKGAKTPILVACLIYFAILIGVSMVLGIVGGFGAASGAIDAGSAIGLQVITQIVITAISMPMMAGVVIIGIQRSVNAPISAGTVLNYFPKILPLLLLSILMYLMIVIGFVLLIIPGIYLMISYYLATPLLVEKNLGAWQALEASRKATTKRWFAIFGLFLLLGLINFATVFTLFIGLIWTIPMSVIAFGILYRNIFGIEPATLN